MGAEKFLPEKYLDSARKNCYATLPDSPLTVTIRKNPGFRALHLVARIPKKGIFLILAAGFYPKNVAFARKLMALSYSGGLHP